MSWTTFLAKKFQAKGRGKGIRLVGRLAIFGIALGVITLLLTQSVLNGFEKVFKESLMGFSAHVAVLRYGGIPQPEALSQQIISNWENEIIAATPFFYRESLLVAGGRVRGAALKGIDPLTFENVYGVELLPWVEENSSTQVTGNIQTLLKSSEKFPTLLLGEDLAKELDVSREKPLVKVFLPQGAAEQDSLNPQKGYRFQSFQVTGTFRAGLKELDAGFALVDRESLVRVFGEAAQKDDEEGIVATGLEFALKNPNLALKIADEIEKALGPGYEVYSWQRLNEPLFQALRMERVLFFVLISMVVAVAAFNVIGVLVLMIFEKKREVALLRSLGSSGRELRRLWVLQGLSLGGAGVLAGIFLSALLIFLLKKTAIFRLAKEIYWVDQLPIELSWPVLLWVLGVSMGMIWLATRFAVRQIQRTPLEL